MTRARAQNPNIKLFSKVFHEIERVIAGYKDKLYRNLEGCKVDERCWAVSVSVKPFPQNLVFCNHKGKPGHEPHGRMHQFKPGFSSRVQSQPFRQP